MESRKMGLMKLFSGQQWRHTQTIDLGMWGRRVGEEGEGGMCGESNMETYNTICKIDSQWESAVCLRELGLEGPSWRKWDGVGGGREVHLGGTCVYLWLIHVDVCQKPTQYCKAIICQLTKSLVFGKIPAFPKTQ